MKKILSITTMFLLSLILVSCNFLQFREYTITFETNGGSEVEPIKVEIGLTIPLDNIITNKDGYNFNGWFLDSSFEQPVSNDLLVFSNLKLYAKWVITRPTTNANYELNGSVFTFDGNSSVYYIYFDGVLIHETNENFIDLANYKEQLLNDVELSILVNNQETLESILSLNI